MTGARQGRDSLTTYTSFCPRFVSPHIQQPSNRYTSIPGTKLKPVRPYKVSTALDTDFWDDMCADEVHDRKEELRI